MVRNSVHHRYPLCYLNEVLSFSVFLFLTPVYFYRKVVKTKRELVKKKPLEETQGLWGGTWKHLRMRAHGGGIDGIHKGVGE